MSTAVATTQPVDLQARALAVFAGGVNPFTAASKAEGVSDGVYGRFNGNTGDFLLGEETAEPGAPVVFEFLTAKQEWLGFDAQNKPVRGPSVSFLSGQPLPDHDNTPGVRWVKQIVVSIVTMDGKRVVYSAKAERPTRAIWRLLNTFGQKMPMMVDDQGRFKMPVVELHARSFSMNVDEPIRLPNGMFDIDPATKTAIANEARAAWQRGEGMDFNEVVDAAIKKVAPKGFEKTGVPGFRKSRPVGESSAAPAQAAPPGQRRHTGQRRRGQ